MASRPATGEPVFRGWPKSALTWFDDLDANNNREWFHSNKKTYDDDVRGPMEALLHELHGEFGDGVLSRPNRDTRFSKDKTPYKLQIYGRISRPEGGGGWYVQVHPGGLFVGGGVWMPDREPLARLRAAIADDRTGPQLEAIVADLESAGLSLMEHGALKTAPRGYDADHPRIRLLRLPHLAAGIQHPPRAWLHTPKAKQRVVDGWHAVTPLMDWAAQAAG